MSVKAVKQVTNVQWPIVGSVVVGITAFGLLMWVVSKLPDNAVTSPVKSAAAKVS